MPEGPMVPVAVTLAMPKGTEVVSLVSLHRADGRVKATVHPVAGHDLPIEMPTLLRWLADLVDLELLPVSDG